MRILIFKSKYFYIARVAIGVPMSLKRLHSVKYMSWSLGLEATG